MTVKYALSTKMFDKLEDLVGRKNETIEFELVDRQICEDVNSGWMQLIPYSSISCYDPNNGDLKFVAYERAEGSGEQRLVNSTSIGFGGHVDSIADITCTDMSVRDDGTKVYHMSVTDLLTTSLAACRREWIEEIGFDPIQEFGVDVQNSVRFTFFRDPDEKNEVGLVHFGVSIPLTITMEQMAAVYEKANIEEREIQDLKEFVINAGQILMSFDVSEVATGVIKRMSEEHKIEPWSVQVISQRLLEYFEMMRSHVSYRDIIMAVKANVERIGQDAQAQQEAMQQAADAAAKAEQDEAAGITDVAARDVQDTPETTAQEPADESVEVVPPHSV